MLICTDSYSAMYACTNPKIFEEMDTDGSGDMCFAEFQQFLEHGNFFLKKKRTQKEEGPAEDRPN